MNDPWLHHIRNGDFASAWEVSDLVLRARVAEPCWHRPRHEQWIWNGTPLAGRRVLVRCYHGLGDTVQFIRYVPLAAQVAAEVAVWAQPGLLGLLRGMPGMGRLLPLHDGDPGTDYDVDVEIMELPHVFRTTLATLPGTVPYLHAPIVKRPAGAGGDDTLAVGVVWRAGDWNERRSLPTASLAPLAAIPGVKLYALQRGRALEEWPLGLGEIWGSDDIEQAAGMMRALDLIVTVDSFPAHLAGALGCPTFLLLHDDPDWRWMHQRNDSPWYPTLRLYRQEHAGEWELVIARVAAELEKIVTRRCGKQLPFPLCSLNKTK